MRELSGNDLSMVFQDPMSSLDPSLPSATSSPKRSASTSRFARAADNHAVELLQLVGSPTRSREVRIPPPDVGGDASAGDDRHGDRHEPAFLIADEPTTALDVTVQAQILDLLTTPVAGMSMILITHDFGVVADICDRAWSCTPVRSSSRPPFTTSTDSHCTRIRRRSSARSHMPTTPCELGTIPDRTGPRRWPRCRFAPDARRVAACGGPPRSSDRQRTLTRCIRHDELRGRSATAA